MIDVNEQAELRRAIEDFYFAYRGFTGQADKLLQRRGLNRVHHRILYFVGSNEDLSINQLLAILGVSKQALNAPLRQLLEMKLVSAESAAHDRRLRLLRLTSTGRKLEMQLSQAQMAHLQRAFSRAGPEAEAGWRQVMDILAR